MDLVQEARKRNNNEGFTLMELLIVVAIISVLLSIAVPVFGTQLEKSREAVDAANIRAAYTVLQAAVLLGDSDEVLRENDTRNVHYSVTESEGDCVYTAVVHLKQAQDGWQSGAQDIAGITLEADSAVRNGVATLTHTQSTGKMEITMTPAGAEAENAGNS